MDVSLTLKEQEEITRDWNLERIEQIIAKQRGRFLDCGLLWALEAIVEIERHGQTPRLQEILTECCRFPIWDKGIRDKFLAVTGISKQQWRAHCETQGCQYCADPGELDNEHLANPGALLVSADTPTPHWFGGADFQLPSTHRLCPQPIQQFFLLDLRAIDPLAKQLPHWSLFPLVGCVVCCLQLFRHDYKVDYEQKRVELLEIVMADEMTNYAAACLNDDELLPNPIPKQYAQLSWLPAATGPDDEEAMMRLERYRGGNGVARVAGVPDWVQSPVTPYCRLCRSKMVYIASLGSNLPDFKPSFSVNNESGYHYHFACSQCYSISVINQNT